MVRTDLQQFPGGALRTRAPWLLALGLAVSGTSHAQVEPPRRTAAPKRVIFYLIDTCRADSLLPYGYDRETTPFLAQLAEEGVVFERCISQGPWTKPSMAAILTSKYTSTTGICSMLQQLPAAHTTFPEVFERAGWYTAGFSANPLMGRLSNYNQGFRYFRDAYQNIPNGDCIRYASGSAQRLGDRVLEWLEKNAEQPYVQGETPLFLYVHSVDPHEEYEPAAEELARFADPAGEDDYRALRRRLLDEARPRKGAADLHRTQADFDAVKIDPRAFMDYQKRLYDADLHANDAQIERLLGELRSRGLLEDSLVVVTADHGDEFFEHGGTSHGFSLYQELIHVPLILWGPGIVPESVRVETPVQSIDVYPTLCELVGLEAPPEVQGRSLVPLLHGVHDLGPRPVFSEKMDPVTGILTGMGRAVAVIDGPWKYVRNFIPPELRPMPEHELFDLIEDPQETKDVSAEHPEEVAHFDALVERWLAESLRAGQGGEISRLSELPAGDRELLRALGYLK